MSDAAMFVIAALALGAVFGFAAGVGLMARCLPDRPL